MRLGFVGSLVLFLLLAGCNPSADDGYQPTLSESGRAQHVYVVGTFPLHNPQRLVEIYGPIIDQVNAGMPGVELRIEASRSYEEYEKKLYAGHFDFAMSNPYQTVRALRHGYRVFGKMGGDEDFRGVILVRKDGPIHALTDLKGRAVAYPAATALAATLLTQDYLQSHGIAVEHELENRYVGSQESSVAEVERGHVAAATISHRLWKGYRAQHPEVASQLVAMWETEPLPSNSWMARQNVPASDVEKFAGLLFGLKDSERGRNLLTRTLVTHFEPANNETYAPVQAFLENFSRTVRPLEY